jgi:hypothetical protein
VSTVSRGATVHGAVRGTVTATRVTVCPRRPVQLTVLGAAHAETAVPTLTPKPAPATSRRLSGLI